jgi:3-oxoacyl-[acyl-carrier-protein] synthase-3
VAAAEKMSGPALSDPPERNVGILFGDGAGACLVGNSPGVLEIVDSVLHSDGTYVNDLRLPLSGPVQMNGRTVILQASRRIPAAITEVLSRQDVERSKVHTFLLHQANSNLTARIAKVLDIPLERFYSNISHCGNTSSASMLIAASQWSEKSPLNAGDWVCFAAFGAGFHWGALLTRHSIGVL